MLSRAPHIPSLRAHPCLALTSQAHAAHPDPDSGSAVESRRAKRILEHNKARDSSAHNREDKRALVAIVQFLCNGKSTASASKHWGPLAQSHMPQGRHSKLLSPAQQNTIFSNVFTNPL